VSAAIGTLADLFDRWDRHRHLAADLGVSSQHLWTIRQRGSLPLRYWRHLVDAAARRGIEGVDYELLVRLHVPAGMMVTA
jgi:hypothetical protein